MAKLDWQEGQVLSLVILVMATQVMHLLQVLSYVRIHIYVRHHLQVTQVMQVTAQVMLQVLR